ncbi:MAG: hypothetical protein ACI9OJ_002481, partial [Myxococcota bacterium]
MAAAARGEAGNTQSAGGLPGTTSRRRCRRIAIAAAPN